MQWENFLKRSMALAIDLAVFYIPARIAGFHHGELVILWLLYETVLVSQNLGMTIGKKAMRLRVASIKRGQVTPAKAFIRAAGKLVSTLVFFLGDLWMLRDKKSRTWHDKWAGTIVVQNVK